MRLLIALLLAPALFAAPRATAAPTPAKPHGQLVEEVMAFLLSDVGNGGIRTYDDDPAGAPCPPWFYHFAIQHDDDLDSRVNGYPGYLSISYPAYTVSVAIDAYLGWWAYSGDPEGLARSVQAADWLLERRTPGSDLYGDWPYSTQTDGVMGGGFDGDAVMGDKPAMLGLRLLRLHRITGEPRFLDGARQIGDTYVATQLVGGVADEGRWPFRVVPADGTVRQDYTSNLVPAVRFLERLEEAAPGHGYGGAAQRAWAWLLANPLEPTSPSFQRWEGFYEDQTPEQQTGYRDHYSAELAVEYLIDHAEEPGYLDRAVQTLAWSTATYLAPWSMENGYDAYAPVVLEWEGWPHSTYAAAGQWAWTQLRLDAATRGTALHDPIWRERAVEALHTLTHGQGGFAPPGGDGRMLTTIRELTDPTYLPETWYEQNFNTVKYMLLSFGLAPELAPDDEEHLLAWSGGELTGADYGSVLLAFDFDGAGTARLKLSAPPHGVLLAGAWSDSVPAGEPLEAGWRWDGANRVLDVAHPGGTVQVVLSGEPPVDAPPASSALRLGPARPNPANPRAVIPFVLARSGRVEITVVDARGRRVTRLLEGVHPVGKGQVVWDGTDAAGRPVASGAYRVVLESLRERRATTVVLVR
jgi:hypothetical protein